MKRRGRPVSPPKHLESLMGLAILDEKNKDEKWKRVEEEANFVTSKKRFHQIEKLSERYHIPLPDHKAKNISEK